MDTPMLDVRGITKAFGGTSALNDVGFKVAQGEIVCLLGPSGCGKTTLLRIIAGLVRPSTGQVGIFFEDKPIPKESRRK